MIKKKEKNIFPEAQVIRGARKRKPISVIPTLQEKLGIPRVRVCVWGDVPEELMFELNLER